MLQTAAHHPNDTQQLQLAVVWACCTSQVSCALVCPDKPYVICISAAAMCRNASLAVPASFSAPACIDAVLVEQLRKQVPLLLELGEGDRALSKASDAGDPDLVYLALFKLYRARPLPAFLSSLASRPLARHLFLAYCSKAVRRACAYVNGSKHAITAIACLAVQASHHRLSEYSAYSYYWSCADFVEQ